MKNPTIITKSQKKWENEEALVTKEMALSNLGKNIFIGDSAATSQYDKQQNGSLQFSSHKWVSNDWKWTKHHLHPQRKIGYHLQTQGWIHGKRNLGCENCSSTKP